MGLENDETFNITVTAKIVGDYYIMESKRVTVKKELKTDEESYRFKEIKIIETEEEKSTLKSLKRTKRFRKY